MATGKQMQEAFQQQQHELQVLTASMAAMETQLQFQTVQAHQAEQERSRLIENMGSTRMDCGSAMVDTKGIGQLFTLKGTSEQDFGEWNPQSAEVHACKVRRRHSDCSNLGSTTAKDCCQDLRSFEEESHDILEHLCSETKLAKIRSRTSMTLLDNYTPTLYPLQPTHLTELSEILEKEMVWKRGDDCTARTIRYHP